MSLKLTYIPLKRGIASNWWRPILTYMVPFVVITYIRFHINIRLSVQSYLVLLFRGGVFVFLKHVKSSACVSCSSLSTSAMLCVAVTYNYQHVNALICLTSMSSAEFTKAVSNYWKEYNSAHE